LVIATTVLAAEAGAPPTSEAGRVRTTAGIAGPDWALWGDLAVHLVDPIALRGGLEVPLSSPLAASLLAELNVGPYRLRGFAAGGVVAQAPVELQSLSQLSWRAEAGARVLIRWGMGVCAAATLEPGVVGGRTGAWMEW